MATGDAADRLRAPTVGHTDVAIAGTGREGWSQSPPIPTSTSCCAPRPVPRRSKRCSRRSKRGKTIALANKEVLVMAGGIVMEAARRNGVAILPVDSEHNAVHQCLHGRPHSELRRIVLTASGGPFRGRTLAQLEAVTAAEALKHPTWQMGRKITIDSATLMNKGLEVIEARWLFGIGAGPDRGRRASAVGRPLDGRADGRVADRPARRYRHAAADPVRLCVSGPVVGTGAPAGSHAPGQLDFEVPGHEGFPASRWRTARCGRDGSLAVVLNAANEVAVARFLDGTLSFPGVAQVIERTMDAHKPAEVGTLTQIRTVDAWAREHAHDIARGIQLKV